MVLKLDLVNAYDRLKWTSLWLVLLWIGLSLEIVNWIMTCVSTVNFYFLINGRFLNFFKVSRGIREMYPLFPFLFLLVIEALSRLLKKEKRDNVISGVKVLVVITLTHLLFVGDA